MGEALERIESKRLVELEDVVERGLASFVEVGRALGEIRDSRLYREDYATFEAYCRERWGFNASRARQLIGAATVAGRVESVTTVTPATERQARPLMKIKDQDEQRTAWARAVETAPDGKVTARHVEVVVVEAMGEPAAQMPTRTTDPRVGRMTKKDPSRIVQNCINEIVVVANLLGVYASECNPELVDLSELKQARREITRAIREIGS